VVGCPRDRGADDEQSVRYLAGARGNTYGNATSSTSSPDSRSKGAFRCNKVGPHTYTSYSYTNDNYIHSNRITLGPPTLGQQLHRRHHQEGERIRYHHSRQSRPCTPNPHCRQQHNDIRDPYWAHGTRQWATSTKIQ
jgi:hypothetical protein